MIPLYQTKYSKYAII